MRTLVLGGVKSGKSRFAEQLAHAQDNPVTLIVTAQALDDEMRARIDKHRSDRPEHWSTVEAPLHLGQALCAADDGEFVIIDCLTLWLTNLLIKDDPAMYEREMAAFEHAVAQHQSALVMVSNETNMGVVPMSELARKYCDQVGLLHQRMAALCERVTLVLAGLPLDLKNGER
jgi:adenosylcobinamide kinase/adenosylcobinamide-phosphate guanylyltransferase